MGDVLWSDINQVVAGDNQNNWQQIRKNGFRVGVAAKYPPDSLVNLLTPASPNSNTTWMPVQTTLQSVVVRDGTPTEVTASPFFTHCRVAVADPSETIYREFELAQGKYQITARKTQDGWVELDFVPVMYHADEKTRPTATAAGTFAWQHGQKQKVFHPSRFRVRVMVGEWVVIGGNRDLPGTLGHQFYFGTEADDQQLQEYRRRAGQNGNEQSGEDSTVAANQKPAAANQEPAAEGEFQRLLVVRIANMKPAIVR
jgi:hypothetical protein